MQWDWRVSKRAGWMLVSAAVVMSWGGCVVGPSDDSETHWAKLECAQDADCPTGLACLCNRCTIRCDVSSQCDALSPRAICASPETTAASCEIATGAGASGGICTMGCEVDSDCDSWGPGHTCKAGACVVEEIQGSGFGNSPDSPLVVDAARPIPGVEVEPPDKTTPDRGPDTETPAPDGSDIEDDKSPRRDVCDEDPNFALTLAMSDFGGWTLALPAASDRYTERLLAAPGKTLVTWSHRSEDVTAASLTRGQMASRAMESALDALDTLDTLGTLSGAITRGEFEPSPGLIAATSSARVTLPVALTGGELRAAWLTHLYSGAASSAEATLGLASRTWRVRVTAIHRTSEVTYLLAVQPEQVHTTRAAALQDAVDPAILLSQQEQALARCDALSGHSNDANVDTHWLIALTSSDSALSRRLLTASASYWRAVKDHVWRALVGDASPGARMLEESAGWSDDRVTHAASLDAALDGRASTLTPDGLAALIEHQRLLRGDTLSPELRARGEATFWSLILADDEAPDFAGEACGVQQIVRGSCAHTKKNMERIDRQWRSALPDDAHVALLATDGEQCGEVNTAAYRHLTASTRGAVGSLCDPMLDAVLEEIAIAEMGSASSLVLPSRPITASLKVYKDGEPVPRDARDGYTYDVIHKSLLFHGSWRDRPGTTVQVRYEERP